MCGGWDEQIFIICQVISIGGFVSFLGIGDSGFGFGSSSNFFLLVLRVVYVLARGDALCRDKQIVCFNINPCKGSR